MDRASAAAAQAERELAYYRRECNDLGARLLRLQEEQSQAFREARRSRTVAKLIREAHRIADQCGAPEEIGGPMLEVILENALCDCAALLYRDQSGPDPERHFRIAHSVGLETERPGSSVFIPSAPSFFFTTSRTSIEPPAYELMGVLRVPYILWAHDRATGHALILGNRMEGNVTRPFDEGDQELVEGALSVYIDVLLRKQAEMELRAAKAAAEEAGALRGRFLATLSHELRTPLNAIIGFSEMLSANARREVTRDERIAYSGQILESGRSLLALINDILDYSSLSHAAPLLRPEWLSPQQVVGGVISEAGAMALAQEVTLEAHWPETPLLLSVDHLRFRQVLRNLVSNAVKFTPPGGRVAVTTVARSAGGAAIVVSDTGIGMRAEDIPRALEPFQQIDGGHARAFPGAGLGLPIAKGLVEAHGGELLIESRLGTGTSVTIVLPPDRVRERPAS